MMNRCEGAKARETVLEEGWLEMCPMPALRSVFVKVFVSVFVSVFVFVSVMISVFVMVPEKYFILILFHRSTV